MEAAFVDIGTPKNAVLYRGDVQYEAEDIVERSERPRIEQMLKARQTILCQVTKNPIGAKGARLTQEVSLPGRFVVLIPNSRTYGISKRLPDDERKRLRSILDRIKPAEHGVIVRTAAENVVEEELEQRRAAAAAPVGGHRGGGQQGHRPDAALPRAGHGRAGHPGGVQQGVPGRPDRRPGHVRRRQRVRRLDHAGPRRPGGVLRRRGRRAARCSSGSTSTSSSTRPSTARCGCPRAGR